jgi:acetylornithine/N-succinyldiaminopimelate aminotransferase
MNHRELFFRHVAQTSASPLALEIVKAQGCSLYDVNGKEYIDLVGGISVANIGHCHPKVIEAIELQLKQYLHIMVYGEFIQSPQVQYAKLLTDNLPPSLDSVYFTNSGAEAVEGAMKLAKKFTGRTEIFAFNHSYHGSTQGALSIIGDEYWRNAFRPLLPGILHGTYNSFESLNDIGENTACVIAETVQAEAGIITPSPEWINALRDKCTRAGALLILDEIQTGFGRTGTIWGFQNFDIIPDILLLGKALGGGMPLGAFIANKNLMQQLCDNPILGHITTFGGHPISCTAGMAAMHVLLNEITLNEIKEKEKLFRSLLTDTKIKKLRSYGLWLAIELESFDACKKVVAHCIANGVLIDWFLFNSESIRISPPLNITGNEIRQAASIIMQALDLI